MTLKMTSTKAAAFYALASVAAGGLHYLFQLWSATQLSSLEFGELTSWIAYFSIALTLGAFAQYGANFFPVSARTLKRLGWGAMCVAAITMAAPFAVSRSGGIFIGSVGVVLGIIFSWFSGQAQSKLAFVVMGIGVILTGVTKFVFAGATFPVERDSLEMAWAVALCYSPAIIWMAMAMVLFADKWTPTTKRELDIGRGLGATALLSFASVYIPQMDIVAIHNTQTPEMVGEFARISLLYKAVFFGFLIFAQWLLPQQIGHSDASHPIVRWVGKSRWRVLFASAIMGTVAFMGSLTIGMWFNPALRDQILWIFLSCVNMVFLTNLFFAVQVSCVKENLIRPALIALFLVIELLVCMYLRQPITHYLSTVIIMNFLGWLILTRPSKATQAATVTADRQEAEVH